MTLQLSRTISGREVPEGQAERRLNTEVVPVVLELARKSNAHVTLAEATGAAQLETIQGRILLVDVAPGATVTLPVEHKLGDEVLLIDSSGFMSRYISDGDTWRRLADAGGLLVYRGTGSPNGVITASPGALYLNASGGAGTTLYVKESGVGNVGWVGK